MVEGVDTMEASIPNISKVKTLPYADSGVPPGEEGLMGVEGDMEEGAVMGVIGVVGAVR
jgi:hypothetical protein